MAVANGINSLMVINKQSAEGTKALATGAQILRRVTAEFATVTDKFSSDEIRQSEQQGDTRLSNYRVEGTLSGELSATTYEEEIAAVLRKDFVAGPSSGAIATIAATSSGFTDSGNAWISGGFKVGMIVRPSGFAGTASVHNTQNFLVTAVTANLLSCSALNGDSITAQAAGDTVTVAATGKRTYTPTTGHTKDWFTVAIENVDVTVYRTFVDNIVNTMEIKVPAAGMSTIDFGFIGKTEDPVDSSAYFTSPTAQTGTGNFSGATAILDVNGTLSTVCTNMEINIDSGGETHPVIGSKYVTAVTRAKVMGTGVFTVFLEDDTYLEYFREETEISISYGMAATTAINADAMALHAPRIKLTSAEVSDGETSKFVTCNFDMLERLDASTVHEATTLVVQDTTL
jgi:hypothetical protein